MDTENGNNPLFLKEKYNLHNSPEVQQAAERTFARTGKRISLDPADRIQNYLNRFSEIIERKDPHDRERGIEAIKNILHSKYIIKPDEIPESYFEIQKRIAQEQGYGEIEINDAIRNQHTEIIIADQKASLDNWIDYLASPDAPFPDWLKYFAIRNVVRMGPYDRGKNEFLKRSRGTTKPFPELNPEALSRVFDSLKKKYQETLNLDSLEENEREQFKKILERENFAELYAWEQTKVTPTSVDLLSITEGKWVKYEKSSDHMPLVQSLQGYGTGWCTAGESTAKVQLSGGDFYVYYSNDSEGNTKIPRVAIRMQSNKIAEIRGIAPQQNFDEYITPIVEEKLKEFPDGTTYLKKTHDMKLITELERKVKKQEELNKDELRFLYEIDNTIEGFGYSRDPRIHELKASRDHLSDLMFIFDVTENEVASDMYSMNEDTKLFMGNMIITNNTHLPSSLHYIDGKVTFSKQNGPIKPEIGYLLMNTGRYQDVVRNLSVFSEIDHNEVARILIQKGTIKIVADNLARFQNLEKHTALQLISSGYSSALRDKIHHFQGLDNEVAQRLIEVGEPDIVASELNLFRGVDHVQFADSLLADDKDQILAEHIDQFNGLDYHRIYDILFQKGKEIYILRKPNSWSDIDGNEIALRFIRDGKSLDVARNLNNFQRLNSDVLDKLASNGHLERVVQSLDKFEGVDHNHVAQLIIDAKRFDLFIGAIPADLERLDDNIAHQLINAKHGSYVAMNLNRFNLKDSKALAIELINEGEGLFILMHLGLFDQIDQQAVLSELIQKVPSNLLSFFSKAFDDSLQNQIAMSFIKIGDIQTLANNLSNFVGLGKDIVSILLEKGFFETVANNLDSFTKLDQSVAETLIKNGFSFAVDIYRDKFEISDPTSFQELIDQYPPTFPDEDIGDE